MPVVIPGDSLDSHWEAGAAVTIGPGLYKCPRTQNIIPVQTGTLQEARVGKAAKSGAQETLIYLNSDTKRYLPQVNDYVLGIVTHVYSDHFRVSLQEFSPGVQLSMMAFPNATKKNRPNLKIGQAVYARVSEAVPEVVTEIECIDPETGKEGGFGPLDETGYIFDVHMNFARELLFNKLSVFLETLASRVSFDIAIGINGKIWLKCGVKDTPALPEGDAEMDGASGDGISMQTLRLSLAGANFLTACQTCKSSEVDVQLKKAFQGLV